MSKLLGSDLHLLRGRYGIFIARDALCIRQKQPNPSGFAPLEHTYESLQTTDTVKEPGLEEFDFGGKPGQIKEKSIRQDPGELSAASRYAPPSLDLFQKEEQAQVPEVAKWRTRRPGRVRAEAPRGGRRGLGCT